MIRNEGAAQPEAMPQNPEGTEATHQTVEEFLDEGLIAKCGINCRFCASYEEHIKSDADKQRCSDVWFRFMAFRVDPKTIQACPGCAGSVYYGEGGADGADCAIRKCARSNGVRTCAHCSGYRAGCTRHHGAQGDPDEDHRSGPEPANDDERLFFGDLGYAQGGRSPEDNLATIRASLAPEDIVRVDEPVAQRHCP